jgi:hypothetical protein
VAPSAYKLTTFLKTDMSLTAGERVGPYEILSLLGAGGPAFVRPEAYGELRRGLAEANWKPR